MPVSKAGKAYSMSLKETSKKWYVWDDPKQVTCKKEYKHMMKVVLCFVKIKKKMQGEKKRACAWNSQENAEEKSFLHYKYSTTTSPSFTLDVQLESRHNKDANANDYKLLRLFVISSEKEDTKGIKEKV